VPDWPAAPLPESSPSHHPWLLIPFAGGAIPSDTHSLQAHSENPFSQDIGFWPPQVCSDCLSLATARTGHPCPSSQHSATLQHGGSDRPCPQTQAHCYGGAEAIVPLPYPEGSMAAELAQGFPQTPLGCSMWAEPPPGHPEDSCLPEFSRYLDLVL